jgi:hypothetical protein
LIFNDDISKASEALVRSECDRPSLRVSEEPRASRRDDVMVLGQLFVQPVDADGGHDVTVLGARCQSAV